MNQFDGLMVSIPCCLLLLVSACSTYQNHKAFLESRQSVAVQLEEEQNYADALLQWKILAAAYPENPEVTANIRRLEAIVEQQVLSLHATIQTQRESPASGRAPGRSRACRRRSPLPGSG